MSSFSAAVFIVGGSGIAFALSATQTSYKGTLWGESRVKLIELVWVVSNAGMSFPTQSFESTILKNLPPAAIIPLLPQLSSMMQQSIYTPIRISVFYTRVRAGKQPAFIDASSARTFGCRPAALNLRETPTQHSDNTTAVHASVKRKDIARRVGRYARHRNAAIQRGQLHSREPEAYPRDVPQQRRVEAATLPPGLTFAPGRPNLVNIIENVLDKALLLGQSAHRGARAGDAPPRMTGLLVGVCGPLAMADDVSSAVGMIDAVRRDQVGGIELVEETFGW